MSDIEMREIEIKPWDPTGLAITLTEQEALDKARSSQASRLFTNVEKALAIDKVKSERRNTREFMCIRDQVLVLPVEKEEFDDSGLIVLPANAQEKQSEGIVIAVGRAAWTQTIFLCPQR